MPTMARWVTSDRYRVDIGAHVFPTAKYSLIVEQLVREHGVRPDDFVAPDPAEPEEILRVHTGDYYRKCRDNRLNPFEIMQMELPWSPALFDAARRCVRGTIMAADLALDHRAGLHVGGGFHHAYPDHGEGFCVFNDIACAVRHAQAIRGVGQAAVIDCDLHHGNGTAAVFRDDPTVSTYSIHQDGIYPAHRPPSTVDVGLPGGTGDAIYLGRLESSLLPFLDDAAPELAIYVDGADPYREDQLGTLRLSLEGLRARDRLVVEACGERDVPLVVVLAGGYAVNTADTVAIHVATLREVATLWRDDHPRSRCPPGRRARRHGRG